MMILGSGKMPDKIPDNVKERKKNKTITSTDVMRYRMLLAVTHSPKAQVSNITSRVEMIKDPPLTV